eukprot:6207730-Pleurochrysis_carterae.AAC.1
MRVRVGAFGRSCVLAGERAQPCVRPRTCSLHAHAEEESSRERERCRKRALQKEGAAERGRCRKRALEWAGGSWCGNRQGDERGTGKGKKKTWPTERTGGRVGDQRQEGDSMSVSIQ